MIATRPSCLCGSSKQQRAVHLVNGHVGMLVVRSTAAPPAGCRAHAHAARTRPGGRRAPPAAAAAAADLAPAAGAEPLDARFSGLKVFVAGATGGTGREVVAALRARGARVVALARDAAAAASKLPQAGDGLEIVQGDVMDYGSVAAAMRGCNAVVVATGARDPRDPLGPLNVDFNGTLNLIEAAKRAGAQRFVLVTSIGADELLNPLNLFWGVLVWKKQAELVLARSGLTYTVVRPGGLKSSGGSGGGSDGGSGGGTAPGGVVMARAGTYGFPPMRKSGSILRSQVAAVCAEALVCDAAKDKVVEVIAEASAPQRPLDELFASI